MAAEVRIFTQRIQGPFLLHDAFPCRSSAAGSGRFCYDFRFTSPYDDNVDKPTYFERCWKGNGWIERHDLETIAVHGDKVFVTYRCVAKGGRSFRNTEFFVFDGDRVKRIEVYFGPAWDNGIFVPHPR